MLQQRRFRNVVRRFHPNCMAKLERRRLVTFQRRQCVYWEGGLNRREITMREKCPNIEFLPYYSVNLHIQSEYRKIRTRKKLRIWTLFTQYKTYKTESL